MVSKPSCACISSQLQNHSQSQFVICGRTPQTCHLGPVARVGWNSVRGVTCTTEPLTPAPSVSTLSPEKHTEGHQCINHFRGAASPLDSKQCQEGKSERWKEMQSRQEWTSSLDKKLLGTLEPLPCRRVDCAHMVVFSQGLGVTLQSSAHLVP